MTANGRALPDDKVVPAVCSGREAAIVEAECRIVSADYLYVTIDQPKFEIGGESIRGTIVPKSRRW